MILWEVLQLPQVLLNGLHLLGEVGDEHLVAVDDPVEAVFAVEQVGHDVSVEAHVDLLALP